MSIEVMSQVMLRYPAGGGERLVAMALADNASSDGQRIFPSVDDIAHRAFLSRRAVQRHLQRMVTTGWLVLVRATSGRPGDTNHYRISAEWLAGHECVAPAAVVRREPVRKPKQQTGDILAPVGSVDNSASEPPRQVTKQVWTGDTSVTQTIKNHQNTNTPLTPLHAPNCGQPAPRSEHPNRRTSGLAVKAGAPRLPSWVVKGKRWKTSRKQVEQVGELLGIGKWNRLAYENARQSAAPDQVASLSYPAYEVRVLQMVSTHMVASHG